MTYRLDGASSAAAATLIKLAKAHLKLGDWQRTLSLLTEAERELEPGEELRLVLLVRQTAASALCDGGEPQQAREVLQETQSMAEELGDPILLIRRSWLHAKLSLSLMHGEEAESLFVAVLNDFHERSLPHAAPFVSLDLARLYMRQGREEDAGKLLDEVIHLFQSLGVPAKAQEAQTLRERMSCR
jgi:ATP/maltotriose-dependent transcriptional regulator MalT